MLSENGFQDETDFGKSWVSIMHDRDPTVWLDGARPLPISLIVSLTNF